MEDQADPLAAHRQAALDYLIEIETLYLCVRDRIDHLMARERESGQPNPKLFEEYRVAQALIRTHAELAKDLG